MRGLCCILLSAILASAQEPARHLGGVVLDDLGKPVAGVEVVVQWRDHPELPGPSGWSLPDGATSEQVLRSDTQGRFRFDPRADAPCAVFARGGDRFAARVFPVLPGEFVRLRLEPTFALEGDVVDPHGAAVPDCEVRLLLADASMAVRVGTYQVPHRDRVVRTDERGRFRLPFEHGYLRSALWPELHGLVAATEDGRCSGVQRRLRPEAFESIVRLQVSGVELQDPIQVVDASTGAAIAGAKVLDCGLPHLVHTTDPDGRVVAAGCSGQLWVSAPGYSPIEATALTPGARPLGTVISLTPCARRRVANLGAPLARHEYLLVVPSLAREFGLPFERIGRVGEDGAIDLDELPQRGAWYVFVSLDGCYVPAVSGSGSGSDIVPEVLVPMHRTLRGQVLDPNGVPASHARVNLDADGWPTTTAWTDVGGRFAVSGALQSGANLRAVLDGRGFGSVALDVEEFERNPITLRLQRGRILRGQVRSPDGTPLAGAWVAVTQSKRDAPELPDGPQCDWRSQVLFTDVNGDFRFESLSGSSATIEASILRDGVRSTAVTNVTLGDDPEPEALLLEPRITRRN